MATAAFTIEQAAKIHAKFKSEFAVKKYWSAFTEAEQNAFFAAEQILLKAGMIYGATYNED